MKFFDFKNDKPQTAFAPTWRYKFGEVDLKDISFDKISDIILNKEKEIIESHPSCGDGNTGLGNDSLTSRHNFFNVLQWDYPEIHKLKEKILYYYKEFLGYYSAPIIPTYIQCWANVLRFNQQIKTHTHDVSALSYLGGHLTVQSTNTFTSYICPNNKKEFKSPNTVGKLTIFQNCLPHYTSVHQGINPRISIAFDFFPHEKIQHLSEEKKKNLVVLND
jgi:hypothetical protein|tara:strand:+ start:929 stop:1585 length:657 start_codon:yes stop_codon:yes gene_type:complete